MKTQYTPGPWHAGGLTVYGGSGARLTVADTTCCGSMTRAEDEANAQLIAAAPDLLAALDLLTQLATSQLNQSATDFGLVNCDALAAARAAITKAKGETK